MNKPPAFQFYVDDFLGGTMNLTDAELGLYIRLLCVQWSAGSLPDDDQELLSYGRGETPLTRVKSKFKKCSDGKLRNTRMELERKKQNAFRKSRALNGKLGGRPRKASDNLVLSTSKPNGLARKSSPSPISVSTLHTSEGNGSPLVSDVRLIALDGCLKRIDKRLSKLEGADFPHAIKERKELKAEREKVLEQMNLKA